MTAAERHPARHGPVRDATQITFAEPCVRCGKPIRFSDEPEVIDVVTVRRIAGPALNVRLAHRRGHCNPIRWLPDARSRLACWGVVAAAYIAVVVLAWAVNYGGLR